MAAEESSDAADAAMSEFECLAGGIQATLPFVESRIREPHRVFDRSGIGVLHTGILPGERDFQSQNLPPNPVPKTPNGTVIKFRVLTSILGAENPRSSDNPAFSVDTVSRFADG